MNEVPVNLWHEDVGIVRKDLREASHVSRFQDEIELLVDGIGEFLHHLHRVQEPAFGQVFFHQGGEPAQHPHVRGNHLIDPLTLDLDYDLVARLKRRPVDLGDAGGRQRLRMDHAERRIGGHIIVRQRLLDLLPRDRTGVPKEPAQLSGKCLGN